MTDYETEIEEWRAARQKRLAAPDGWLALVGRVLLADGELSLGADPSCDVPLPPASAAPRVATLHVSKGRVRIVAAPLVSGAQLTVGPEREPVTDRELGLDDVLSLGTLRMQLLKRGEETYLRVRDERSKARLAFTSIPHFPVDRRWRVLARLERAKDERTIELPYAEGGVASYRSPGVAVFTIAGEPTSGELRLPVLLEKGEPRTFFMFKDLTSGNETYGAGRFLYAPLPDGDRLVLDFNMAFNPPCALTEYASCPIVPRDSRLDVAISAGEKVFSPEPYARLEQNISR